MFFFALLPSPSTLASRSAGLAVTTSEPLLTIAPLAFGLIGARPQRVKTVVGSVLALALGALLRDIPFHMGKPRVGADDLVWPHYVMMTLLGLALLPVPLLLKRGPLRVGREGWACFAVLATCAGIVWWEERSLVPALAHFPLITVATFTAGLAWLPAEKPAWQPESEA